MLPLLIVGLLTISPSARADVSHVLRGSANPDSNSVHYHQNGGALLPCDINHGFQTAFTPSADQFQGAATSPSGNRFGAGASPNSFWWTETNSPFKHAYDHYKKCSDKGNCQPPTNQGFQLPNDLQSFESKGQADAFFGPIDVKKNPFLNGDFQGISISSCTGGDCKGGKPQTTFTSCKGIDCQSTSVNGLPPGGVNVAGNPFLNGGVSIPSGPQPGGPNRPVTGIRPGGGNIDISGNPFLNGQIPSSGGGHFGTGHTATTGNGATVISDNEGFIGVQPSKPFGGHGTNGKPFPTTFPGQGSSSSPGGQPFPTNYPSQGSQKPFPSTPQGGQRPFPTTFPTQSTTQTLFTSPSQKPFPTNFPGQSTTGSLDISGNPFFGNKPIGNGDDKQTTVCSGSGYLCVRPEQCINGVVNKNGEGLLQVRTDVQQCQKGKEVCCRIGKNPAGNYRPNEGNPFLSTTSGATGNTGAPFVSNPIASNNVNPNSASHLGPLVGGKSSVPGSVIKFAGGPGLSPGVILVQPVYDESPNPSVSSAGQSGQGVNRLGSTNPKLTPNALFSSTVDYSDTKFDQISFASTIQGPQYLPPDASPTPGSHNDNLEPPVFNTYQPQFPSTPRPIVPGPSVVSPFTVSRPSSVFTQTTRPFVPSTPKPFVPIQTTPRPYSPQPQPQPSYRPSTFVSTPSTFKPIEYVPPQLSTPKPFVPQPTYPGYDSNINNQYVTPKKPVNNEYLPPYPSTPRVPPFIPQQPTTPRIPYIPPQPTPTLPPYRPPPTQPPTQPPYRPPPTQPPTQPPYRPPPTQPPTQPPYRPPPTQPPTQPPYRPPPTQPPYRPPPTQPPYIPPPTPYRPPQTQPPYKPPPTGGYSYPTPTPSFEYPTPTTSSSNININNQYLTPKQPQRPSYSTPAPSYSYPTPTRPVPTRPPLQPQPSFPAPSSVLPPKITVRPTNGYSYPEPTPSFSYPTPPPYKPPTPTQPQYKPPTPTQPPYQPPQTVRPYQPPTPTRPPYKPPTPTPYRPPPSQPSPGYSYPTPQPPFVSEPSQISTVNQYLPPKTPRPYDGSDSNININTAPRPTSPRPSYIPPVRPDNYPDSDTANGVAVPYPSCAAALKCVQEIYCTAEGIISPVPVVLTPEQELARVPTTECSDKESGITGKCCRDPNYVDPWPSANLINGSDDGQYREDPNLGQYRPNRPRFRRYAQFDNGEALRSSRNSQYYKNSQALVRGNNEPESESNCGVRRYNTKPRGPGPIDAGFAEFPWQAMILRAGNRSLLCGGVIIQRDVVLTAAHCVDGLETNDILVKGGEWKLGIDEEPLPFQINKVSVIIRHPNYVPGVLQNDLAILKLEEKFRTVQNVDNLCMPPLDQVPTQNCLVTGWGKKILQVHLRGAIMRSINVNMLDAETCSNTIKGSYQHMAEHYGPNTLCVYSNNDQCDVDYGSALACADENGQYSLAGIFSWDTGCKDESQIGGYIPPDVAWISSTMSKPKQELRALERQYFAQFSKN